MGITSRIEWTDATWNPWQGCTKVSPACAHCYMFADMARFGKDPTIVRRSKPPTFDLPVKKKADGSYAIATGSKVFTCSWSDWFHEAADPWRPEAWALIRRRPDVTFQIVTKRIDRAIQCLPDDWGHGYPNVILIATVENQEWAEIRIPQLVRIPGRRGLSIEPLLGPIDFNRVRIEEMPMTARFGTQPVLSMLIDWIIVGGESGKDARPMHPNWVRDLRDTCVLADIPFFFKQWGEWCPISDFPAYDTLYVPNRVARDGEDQSALNESFGRRCTVPELIVRTDGRHCSFDQPGDLQRAFRKDLPGHPGVHAFRVGRKDAGRLLDGREWSQFPALQTA